MNNILSLAVLLPFIIVVEDIYNQYYLIIIRLYFTLFSHLSFNIKS